MAVSFYRGQQLGRGDLTIYLANANGTPSDAAEITYALYDFTTGQEVMVGSPRRAPMNPAVGEYYASVIIPLDANLGGYRIRWTFRELVGGPLQQALQEFEVADKQGTAVIPVLSSCQTDLVRRLRVLLRDNCVGGEEEVELDLDGERVVVAIQDLWEALNDLSPPAP